LEKLEKEMRQTPMYDTRHQTKLGYVRYADDFVILVNGTEAEAKDYKNKIQGHLETMGLTLSEEKTKLTHWDKPIAFLGYHIQGELRSNGVQIRAILSIPKEKERLIRRELLKTSRYYHIPELDAMQNMNAKFQGWCNYYKYANNPQVVFNRVSDKMWWFYAHFLAKKHKMSIRKLIINAVKTGRNKVVQKGTGKRKTFIYPVEKREYYLDTFAPKSAKIYAVTTKETWRVDLKPVAPNNWMKGRSATTRLTALARSEGICERCGKNPVTQIHHKNRMKTKGTLLAKVASDMDQQKRTMALCTECHLELHHGRWQG
jgi:hypothetical protein